MLPAASSSQSRSAGYGRSCSNCFRAKSRCALLADGGSCERCRRLDKDCQPMPTGRGSTAKRTAHSRVTQLEDRLDDLISWLESSQERQQRRQQQAHSNHDLHSPIPESVPSSSVILESTAAIDCLTNVVGTERQPLCVADQQGTLLSLPGIGARPTLELSENEADTLLAIFQTWLPGFPFMSLPPQVTAESLQAQRPFLWLCITSLTVKSNSHRQQLCTMVRAEIAERIIINDEGSMDLALGLIAYLGWQVYSQIRAEPHSNHCTGRI